MEFYFNEEKWEPNDSYSRDYHLVGHCDPVPHYSVEADELLDALSVNDVVEIDFEGKCKLFIVTEIQENGKIIFEEISNE